MRFPSFWLVILFSIALFEGVRISNAWNSYRCVSVPAGPP